MSTNTDYANGRLVVTRLYDASREAVFAAWMETSKVEKWWGCDDTIEVKSEIEARFGGKYIHLMTLKGGYENPACGVITEYDPPAVFAYEVPGETPAQTMMFRVEFIERGDATEVRLTHDNIPDEFSKFVIVGWSAAFRKLDHFLTDEAGKVAV